MNGIFGRLISTIGLVALLAVKCSAQSNDAATLQTAIQGTGQQQYTAIDDLGERRTSAATVVPKLSQLLASNDAQVRWRTARALGDYGAQAQSALVPLRGLLGDRDPVVQYHAAVALGKLGDRSDETVGALVKAATGKDANVARAAIAALRILEPGPERVLEVLESTLNSNDQAVTLYGLEAIIERGAAAAPMLTAALKRPKTAYLACAAIEHIGPDAAATVPAIVELLGQTRHSKLQTQALLALASIGPAAKAAVPQIVPLLQSHGDSTVPVAAAFALGSIGASDPASTAALKQAMATDNQFLQMVAAWSLAKSHPDDGAAMRTAVEKLTQGLKSSDATLRAAAAKGLHMLQPPPEMVAPAMVALVNDPDPVVQEHVISAVAGLGEAVVPRVANALENPQLRGPAVRVLTQIGPKAAGAVPALIDAAEGADSNLHTEINLALAAIGPAAAPATKMLAGSITSEHQGVRESALYALRQIGAGAKDARESLLKRMQADDSFAALASAWALAKIASGDAAVAAQAVPKLSHGLSSADDATRLECAEALAAWGPAAKSAVATLQQVAKTDRSSEVRAAAEAALARIAPK
jgi:HEAT repeat protein